MKHLDSYSVGENSKVTLTDVNPNFLPNISITLGMNCTLEIEGILVLNSKLEIIRRDNCDLFLAAGQMMNEKVSINICQHFIGYCICKCTNLQNQGCVY